MKPEFDKLNVRVVGLVHEWIPGEVSEFHPQYWPGDLYHDEQKEFYKALGEGKLVKGSVFAMLNPFSQAWKNIRRAKNTVDKHNLKGDGLTMGGLFVIGKADSGIVFKHVEKTFGEHASAAEVMDAVKSAAEQSAST